MVIDIAGQFRRLLDHLDAEDPDDQLLFFHMANQVGDEGIQELAPRMLRVSSTPAFRLLVAEAAYYYSNPAWVVPLSRALRRESNLEVYSVYVRALAQIGTPESDEELRLLSSLTHEPEKLDLLSAALHSIDPERAFEFHLSRLFQGSSNPSVANQAAGELRRIVGENHLESLQVVVYHEDLLIARHALKLITRVPCWEAGQFLCVYFLECHHDILDDRDLREILATLRPLPVAELYPEIMRHLLERFEDRVPSALERLREAGPEGGAASLEALETLRNWSRGTVEPFLLEALALLLEGKASRLPSLFSEAAAAHQNRGRRSVHALETCAAGLEEMVARKLFAPEDVLDLLHQAFLAQSGKETTARVLGLLLSPTDEAYLESILATQDVALRASALEAIGSRHDSRFLSFLIRACHDPIEDVAERMIHALDGLDGATEQAILHLASRTPEEVRLALRMIRINRMTSLDAQVLAFMDASTREELTLEAVSVLGELGSQNPALLERLHSGQSPRMQMALASAATRHAVPEIALQAARLVQPMRLPELWVVAAEGLIQAHSTLGTLPQEASQALVSLIQACWEEKPGAAVRVRIIQAVPRIQSAASEHLAAILALLVACSEDKRSLAAWTPEQQNQLTVAVRHLKQQMETETAKV